MSDADASRGSGSAADSYWALRAESTYFEFWAAMQMAYGDEAAAEVQNLFTRYAPPVLPF